MGRRGAREDEDAQFVRRGEEIVVLQLALEPYRVQA
eukprot:COSAG04_NODE_21824_length_366_cov_4.146067_1_plen_35_part_10